MRKGINLSLGRKRVNNTFKKAFYVAAAFFCIAVVISIGLILYRLILKSSYDTLEVKEQKLNAQLLSMQEKRDKFTETEDRLFEIKKVMGKRSPVTARMQTVVDVVPADASINSLDGTEKEMQVDLESGSISSLDDLVEQRLIEIGKDKKKGIKKIEMNSFSLNPKTSNYTVSFLIKFN